jgi:hypothetical protein
MLTKRELLTLQVRNASQKLHDLRHIVVPLRDTSKFIVLEALFEENERRMPIRPISYLTYFYGSVLKQFGVTFRT